jgi:hypothetical protein
MRLTTSPDASFQSALVNTSQDLSSRLNTALLSPESRFSLVRARRPDAACLQARSNLVCEKMLRHEVYEGLQFG